MYIWIKKYFSDKNALPKTPQLLRLKNRLSDFCPKKGLIILREDDKYYDDLAHIQDNNIEEVFEELYLGLLDEIREAFRDMNDHEDGAYLKGLLIREILSLVRDMED